MNVLHINQSDLLGGAAIAGYRLHQGLLTQKINSRLMVGTVTTDDSNVDRLTCYSMPDKILLQAVKRMGLTSINFVSSFSLHKLPSFQDADILNFHNLHGYFNYLAIPGLTQHKPAIFTLHDMWSFTGHCTYSYDCQRWQTGCGKCPYPEVHPPIERDSTRLEWHLKDWVYSRSNITVVTPSRWLTEVAKQSMLSRFPIYHIPYGIDINVYQPLDQEECRAMLGIPLGKRVLMFSAADVRDHRKGGDQLLKALEGLPSNLKAEIILTTFGTNGNKFGQSVGIETINLGYIDSDRLKAVAYSAADLFVLPTRADNLPIVLQESMACGTPMIAFNVGGVSDLVRPGITGYLAEAENVNDLCNGIIYLLEDATMNQNMRRNCRTIALEEFSLELQAQRYIRLYHQALQPATVPVSNPHLTGDEAKRNAHFN